MQWDEEKLLLNIRQADSEDLLDRVTAYRATLEPRAIELVEAELCRRGIPPGEIAGRADRYRKECVCYADGTAKMCSLCRKPAMLEGWGWHRLLGKVPVFPRWMCYCERHRPGISATPTTHPRPPG